MKHNILFKITLITFLLVVVSACSTVGEKVDNFQDIKLDLLDKSLNTLDEKRAQLKAVINKVYEARKIEAERRRIKDEFQLQRLKELADRD